MARARPVTRKLKLSLRSVLRRARKTPAHLALVVTVMSLTVGATAVVATLVNALWLRPRPVPEPDRIVNISSIPVHGTALIDMISTHQLQQLSQHPMLEAVAGQVAGGGLMGDFRPALALHGVSVETLAVTPNYFDVLRVSVRGPGFGPERDLSKSDELVIISDHLWRTQFEGDASVIGRDIETSLGRLYVAGIAPPGFQGARLGERAEAWVPFTLSVRRGAFEGLSDADRQFALSAVPFVGLARLKPGIAVIEAERVISAGTSRLRLQALSAVYGGPGQPSLVVEEHRFVQLAAVACFFVVLAGCATLASLLLVQQEKRREELALRLALGASRGALFRELSLELALIASLAVTGSLLLTMGGTRGLQTMTLPGGIELSRLDLGLDWRVVTITIALLLVVTALAAVVAFLRYTRPSLALTLVAGTSTGAPSALAFRRWMLGIHAAATYVLLVGAMLFLQTLVRGFGSAPGFDIDRTIFVRLQPSAMQPFRSAEDKNAAIQRILSDLESLPEVRAAIIGPAPISGDTTLVRNVAIATDRSEATFPVALRAVDPRYASTLGLRLRAGRALTAGDDRSRSSLMTVSLAHAVWPHEGAEQALGRTVRVAGTPYEVVGVVDDFAQGSVRGSTPFALLTATGADAGRQSEAAIVVATHSSAGAARESVRGKVAARFPSAARLETSTGRDLVSIDLARERLSARLLSGFGLIALVLGVVGTYGLVRYSVGLRWRDLGIRLSLGAQPRKLSWELARYGLQPVLVGIGCGAVASAVAIVAGRAFIQDLARPGVVAYLLAAAVLASGAAIAAVAGVRRIRSLSPAHALRVQ